MMPCDSKVVKFFCPEKWHTVDNVLPYRWVSLVAITATPLACIGLVYFGHHLGTDDHPDEYRSSALTTVFIAFLSPLTLIAGGALYTGSPVLDRRETILRGTGILTVVLLATICVVALVWISYAVFFAPLQAPIPGDKTGATFVARDYQLDSRINEILSYVGPFLSIGYITALFAKSPHAPSPRYAATKADVQLHAGIQSEQFDSFWPQLDKIEVKVMVYDLELIRKRIAELSTNSSGAAS